MRGSPDSIIQSSSQQITERQWRGSEAFDSGTAHHATYEESAGLLHGPHLPSDPGDALDDEATREASCLGPGSMDLPEPTLASLPAIAARLTEPSVFDREALVHRLLSPDYLTRLRALFGDAEDLEDVDSLRRLHVIFRGAFLLHDATLIEALVSEDAYMDVLGALEYEPGVDPAARPRHRAWMRERATFREPVRVADEGVRRRIHETYRLSFVKDVALPRVLDDATTATLRSLALFNSVEILVTLTADEQVFPELFARLAAAAPGSDEWRDLVRFLQELAAQAKHLQASQRANLFEKLVALGLFDAMGRVLEAASDPAARLRAADVLLVAALHDPAPLRAHLLAPEAGRALFERLIAALLSPDAARTGMPEQVLELLRVLLDPESMEAAVEQDAFIDAFYATHAGALLSAVVEGSRGLADGGGAGEREAEKAGAADVGANEPIPKPTSASGNGDVSEAAGPRTPEPPSHTSAPSAQSLGLVLELLCFCVTQHSYRIKYYVLRNNVVEKVLRLLRRRELWLRAAALRFLRTCLGMLDDFYNRYLVKNGLLEPVLAAFCANGTRYNLLNSAALELLEFLWRENAKGLLASLVASPQWEAAKRLDATGTFARLLAKHEQNQVSCFWGGAEWWWGDRDVFGELAPQGRASPGENLCFDLCTCYADARGKVFQKNARAVSVVHFVQDREQPPGSTEAGAEAGAQAAPSNGGALAQQARTEAALQQRRIRAWGFVRLLLLCLLSHLPKMKPGGHLPMWRWTAKVLVARDAFRRPPTGFSLATTISKQVASARRTRTRTSTLSRRTTAMATATALRLPRRQDRRRDRCGRCRPSRRPGRTRDRPCFRSRDVWSITTTTTTRCPSEVGGWVAGCVKASGAHDWSLVLRACSQQPHSLPHIPFYLPLPVQSCEEKCGARRRPCKSDFDLQAPPEGLAAQGRRTHRPRAIRTRVLDMTLSPQRFPLGGNTVPIFGTGASLDAFRFGKFLVASHPSLRFSDVDGRPSPALYTLVFLVMWALPDAEAKGLGRHVRHVDVAQEPEGRSILQAALPQLGVQLDRVAWHGRTGPLGVDGALRHGPVQALLPLLLRLRV